MWGHPWSRLPSNQREPRRVHPLHPGRSVFVRDCSFRRSSIGWSLVGQARPTQESNWAAWKDLSSRCSDPLWVCRNWCTPLKRSQLTTLSWCSDPFWVCRNWCTPLKRSKLTTLSWCSDPLWVRRNWCTPSGLHRVLITQFSPVLMRFWETDSVESLMSTFLISNGSRLLSLLKMGVLAYEVIPRWHLLPSWFLPLVPMNSSPLSCYGQTGRSLQLNGIQIPQSMRPFQSGRQDMTQSNQTALRLGSSKRGTWQASGPARIYSIWTQRIHTPELGFWPHQLLTAEIGCWQFQSLHAACALMMRLSELRSVWDWVARSANLMTVYVVNWWMQEEVTLCRANMNQDAWHAITRSMIWYTVPWFRPTFHWSKHLRCCWGLTINDLMATHSFHGEPEETSLGMCRLSTPLQHRTFKPRLWLRAVPRRSRQSARLWSIWSSRIHLASVP